MTALKERDVVLLLRVGQLVCVTLIMWMSLAAAANAEIRLALVVGNSAYRDPGIPVLPNAANDSGLIAARLSDAGFDVTHVVDGDLETLKGAVARFGQRLRGAGREGTGLFYYAGHAVQSYGINFLLPVDTSMDNPADLDLVALDASSVLRQMSSAQSRTNIMILDACRNNPFEALAAFGENGLAEMRAPTGTFLSYATAPGEVALDGAGDHSPFTAALAGEMLTPGLSIEEVFRRVRVDVLERTIGRQTPWDTSSLTREFSFVPGASTGLAAEAQAFSAAQAKGTVEAYEAFLTAHPHSVFAEAASLERDSLAAAAATSGANESAELVFTPVAPDAPRAGNDTAEERIWASVRASQDPAEVALFLRAYPESPFTEEARALLDTTARSAAPAATPAPAVPSLPSDAEDALLETARASQSAADYEAYLAAYPNGVFAELARIELEAVRAIAPSANPAATPTGVELAAVSPQETAPSATPVPPTIGFDQPLVSDSDAVRGKTIAQLITGKPLFPPVEGLPEAYWKNQQCSACHQWETANLCTQAQTYLRVSAEEAGAKRHPYGGTFKQGLRQWAEAGCP